MQIECKFIWEKTAKNWMFLSSEWINDEQINKQTKEQTNEWTKEWTHKWMNNDWWMTEFLEWLNERMNEWTCEWTNKQMNEWMNKIQWTTNKSVSIVKT